LFGGLRMTQNKNTNSFIWAWVAIFESFIELSSASHNSLKQSKLVRERVYNLSTNCLRIIYVQKLGLDPPRALLGHALRELLIVAHQRTAINRIVCAEWGIELDGTYSEPRLWAKG
jgi:hypothetical protein